MTRPRRKASRVNICERGTAKPTVALKKMRMSQRMMRLNCATHTCVGLGLGLGSGLGRVRVRVRLGKG